MLYNAEKLKEKQSHCCFSLKIYLRNVDKNAILLPSDWAKVTEKTFGTTNIAKGKCY